MSQERQTFRYRVDADDQIAWVDRLWLAFAQENGATELTEANVLHRPLWDFVAGETTRLLFSELHRRVRSNSRTVVVPFRCDSPTMQRHMRLTISEQGQGELLYESVLLAVVPQRYSSMLDAEHARSERSLTMCSFCKRALLESDGWLAVEDASVRLNVFETNETPRLTYTVCPECAHRATDSPDNGNAA